MDNATMLIHEVENEKKLKKMEKERPDEMEMAAQKNEEREEKTNKEINS